MLIFIFRKYAIVRMPVGTADPVARLRKIEDQFKELKRSRLPSQFYYLALIISVLPIAVGEKVKDTFSTSATISNFIVPFKRGMAYKGHEIVEVKFALGFHPGRQCKPHELSRHMYICKHTYY